MQRGVLVALFLAFAAACLPVLGIAGSGSPLQALAFVSADLDWARISYTDWILVRAAEGLEHLSSDSPLTERGKLLLAVRTGSHAAPAAFGAAHFTRHADTWGWDMSDHLWEIEVSTYHLGVLFVIGLADWVDLAAVESKFAERGYARTQMLGTDVYSCPDGMAHAQSPLPYVKHIALLHEERCLVIGSRMEGVEAVLETWAGESPAWSGVPHAAALAQAMEGCAGAVLLLGPKVCREFSRELLHGAIRSASPTEPSPEVLAMVDEEFPVLPYAALALGYRVEEGQPVGSVVFRHWGPASAKADLPGRRQLAEHGLSIATGQEYRESLFTVRSAQAVGADVVLALELLQGHPRGLLSLPHKRDMLLGICP